MQLWGTSDPYCIVSVGESARQSRVVERCLDPVWDDDFQLYVRQFPAHQLYHIPLP